MIVSILTVNFASAQEVATFVSEDGVHLRWKTDAQADGYHIYRKDNNSDWQKLTNIPVSFISDNGTIKELLGYQANVYLGMFNVPTHNSDITKALFKKTVNDTETFKWIQIMAVVNHEMAKALGLIYLDETIAVNQSYEYQIRSIRNGVENTWAVTQKVNTAELGQVPNIDELKGKAVDSGAILEWLKDQDQLDKGKAVTYHIYRSDNILGPFERINDFGILPVEFQGSESTEASELQSFVDRYLKNAQSYFYHIKAVNLFGIESLPSETVEIIPGNYEQPSSPINIEVRPFGGGSELTWSYIENDIQGVEIFKSIDNDNYEKIYPYADILLSDDTSYLDLEIVPGELYYYKLVAINEGNIASDTSAPISFTFQDIMPPEPPKVVIATGGKNQITIQWTPSEDKDVEGYYLQQAHYKHYERLSYLDYDLIQDTFHVDTFDPKFEGEYGYAVIAQDKSGNRSKPSVMAKARIIDNIAPLSPIITSSRKEGNTFRFEWTANIEFDFDGYQIYVSEDNEFYAPLETTKEVFMK